MCLHFICLLRDLLGSPDTDKELMVVALSVNQGILHSRISGPHEVVQTYRGIQEIVCVMWSLVNGRQKTSEVVGKDAKCIFDDAPCQRQMIIDDSLIVCQVVAGVGFHQPLLQWESVVTDHEVLHGCVITGKCCWRWKDKGPILKLDLEL